MSAQAIPQVGEKLDHYQLEELLAVGGMGLVFRAYDAPLDRHVAVKVLAPELAADEQTATKFVQEARAMATLSHPNVVHVYNVGEDRGHLYFAMEWVQGDNLEALQREVKQLNLGEAIQLIRQAALGLQHAYRRGIVHSDVKPANLVVTFAGVLKVTDFGLARRTTARQANDFGTPEYASPETIRGQATDHRSDIYALGATFYHLVAGRPPFVGKTNEVIMRQHLRDEPPPVTKFNLKVPPALNQLILRCLEKDPAERYQTYEELISDLDKVIAVKPAAPSAPEPAETGTRSLVVTAVLLVGAVTIAILVWRQQTRDSSGPMPNVTNTGSPQTVTTRVVETVPVPTVSTEDEGMALEAFKAMQAQADALLQEGKLAAALSVYKTWPLQPLHRATRANGMVNEQRERIRNLAMAEWRKYKTQADALLAAHNFPEAVAVCEQAIRALNEFPKVIAVAQDEIASIKRAQNQYQAQQASERAASEQRRQAKLIEVRDALTKLAVGLQWDKAQEEVRATASKVEPELQPRVQALFREDIEPLIALRTGIGNRARTKPGPNITLATRSGDVEGQVIALDADRLTLGHVLAHGVISTPVVWESLPPLSVLRFYALTHDATDSAEQYGFAVLVSHFALSRLARIEDARRELQTALQRDEKRQAMIEPFLNRLADLERRLEQEAALRAAAQANEEKAALAWAQVESAITAKDFEASLRELRYFLEHHKDSECARQRQNEIDRLQRSAAATEAISAFQQLDLGRGQNRCRLLQTVDGEAAQPFEDEVTFVSSALLRKRGIPRHGLPDDGKLLVRLGDQRVPFQITVGQQNDAFLLTPNRRSFTVPLRGKSGKYTHLAILYAAAHQSTDIELNALYREGEREVFTFRAWDWQYQPESGDKNLAVIPVTASNKSRVTLGARLLALDSSRPLENIRVHLPYSDNGEATVAVFGIALLPAR